jgi:Protein of unknown function with HXXEE motif
MARAERQELLSQQLLSQESKWGDPFRLVLLAPVIFPIHVAEETAGGFVAWFNSLVHPPITLGLFLTVNAVCFGITLLVGWTAATSKSRLVLSIALGWLIMLMFENGIFHILGTLRFHVYSPGTVTAVCLYVPYSIMLAAAALRRSAVQFVPLLATLAIVAVPGTIHFYRILFEGSRFF